MQLGIVGLPNVGKSTLFNAITKSSAQAANYPFCTIDPNVGIVQVADDRLEFLGKLYKSQKISYATIEVVDIAGLVKGASKGEGLGNKFLGNIRSVDAIIHMVRCFDDGNVTHVESGTDPVRDIEIIDLELILADMAWIDRRMEKLSKQVKAMDIHAVKEMDLLNRIQDSLEEGIPARRLDYSEDDMLYMDDIYLLSLKPVLYVANISEDDIGNEDNKYLKEITAYAANDKALVIPLSARLEEEISALDDEEERDEFLKDLGLQQTGLEAVVRAGYDLLGLISFITAGPTEVRAWTITRGTRAPQAAGKIHSDMERGFIRAEIVAFDDLYKLGSYNAAREKGLVRSEGKTYVMQDGDVTLIRFNV